jgi:hypothetical protein
MIYPVIHQTQASCTPFSAGRTSSPELQSTTDASHQILGTTKCGRQPTTHRSNSSAMPEQRITSRMCIMSRRSLKAQGFAKLSATVLHAIHKSAPGGQHSKTTSKNSS